MFFEGIRSERRLLETASLNLAHRWYLGYHLDEPLPDHASLTRIRQRLGLATFQRCFEHVVELCREAGLIWGEERFVDATTVRAAAAADALVPRWYQRAKAHVDELFAAPAGVTCATSGVPVDAGERPPAAAPPVAGDRGDGQRGPRPLPARGRPEDLVQLAEANRTTWRLLERQRLDPARPASRGYHRTTDISVSRTDPDAAPMRHHPGDRLALGYHDHDVVDGGTGRIILAALVTPADVMENQAMADLVWRARCRWQLRLRRVAGDTTDGTVETIRALEAAGIRADVPLPDVEGRTPYYGRDAFAYDAARDAYICPRGQPRRRRTAKYAEAVVVSRAAAETCRACPVKAQCTASEQGRTVRRSCHEAYLERVRAYRGTAAYRQALRQRRGWVEPLFGAAKAWHGRRRFRLRGLANVTMEGLLIAAGQNLKRWLTATGWGRRHGPCGALAVASRPSGPIRTPCARRAPPARLSHAPPWQ